MTGFGENGQNGRFLGQNGLFLTVFAPEWRKRDFFWKKRKCHFRMLIMRQHCAKSQNKPMNGF